MFDHGISKTAQLAVSRGMANAAYVAALRCPAVNTPRLACGTRWAPRAALVAPELPADKRDVMATDQENFAIGISIYLSADES